MEACELFTIERPPRYNIGPPAAPPDHCHPGHYNRNHSYALEIELPSSREKDLGLNPEHQQSPTTALRQAELLFASVASSVSFGSRERLLPGHW